VKPGSINAILELQTKQLRGLAEGGSIRRLRSTYQDAQRDLEDRLKALKRKGGDDTFTAQHLRMTLVQVKAALHDFTKEFGAQLQQDSNAARTLSQRHLTNAITGMEKKYRGLAPVLQAEQAGVFRRIYKDVEPSLLNRHRKSLEFYSAPVVTKIRDALAHSTLIGDTMDQAVDRITGTDGVFEDQRWRAERIARTETAFAYGLTKQKSMEGLRDSDFPRMQKKLIATFDNRTGEDSKELHGQTVDVDKPFIWKVKNSKGIIVRTVEYMYPPNRPNDREVVIPWMSDWKETEETRPLG